MRGHYTECDSLGSCSCEEKTYWLVFGLALLIFAAEFGCGLWSKSLALFSDSFHVLSDGLSAIISIIVARFARIAMAGDIKSRVKISKIRAVGGYANAFILCGIALGILYEAAQRFFHPPAVCTGGMMLGATVGILGNYMQHKIMSHGKIAGSELTHGSLDMHILSDLWQSAAVFAGGVIIFSTGRTRVDAFFSAGVAAWMMVQTVRFSVASYLEWKS